MALIEFENLKLFVVADLQQDRELLLDGLPAGASVVVSGTDAASVRTVLAQESIDFVIVVEDILTQEMIRLYSKLFEQYPLPSIMFVRSDPHDLAPAAIRSSATSIIVDGLFPKRLITLMKIALERFKINNALLEALKKSQTQLAARKSVERAKGLIMETKGISEEEAYRTLREMAMREGKPLQDIAETFLSISELLR